VTRPLTLALAVALAVVSTAAPADAATGKRRSRRVVTPPSLVWHVETADGQVLESRNADIAINPASVVKVAVRIMPGSGKPEELVEQAGLSAAALIRKIKEILK